MNSHKERKERKKCRGAGGDCVLWQELIVRPGVIRGVLHQQGSGTVAAT